MLIEMAAGDYRLALIPETGGAIARFEWRNQPLMRAIRGPSILDTACFPLVPFSNRIAFGRFERVGRQIRIAPNFPGVDHLHPLHGFGWLAAWTIVSHGPDHAILRHSLESAEWPWTYVAEQEFQLSDSGLCHELRLRNRSAESMPAGLGLHPYFPRTERTLYHGLHAGEWLTDANGLPLELQHQSKAIDWWQGQPVARRFVDRLYTDRQGLLSIDWPERGLGLSIEPGPHLDYTHVYVPEDADFFCVEPVSHMTDAINRPHDDSGLQ